MGLKYGTKIWLFSMYFILLKLHVNPSEMPDFALKWIMQDGDDTCQCVLDEIQKASP